MAENSDFAIEFYEKMKRAVGGKVSRDQKRIAEKKAQRSKPFDKGRDPITAAAGLDSLLQEFSWEAQLEEAELFVSWKDIVGDINSSNSFPESLSRGKLTVRCKSTAWATQLRLMSTEILSEITINYPELEVKDLYFIGPDAPSWKKGPRSVPGRGPRDTYG
jgi:predicted nucleic acid-binding Zn ribbon protein